MSNGYTAGWTPAEDAALRDMWPQVVAGSLSMARIARENLIPGRGRRAIENRVVRLGLPAISRAWTDAELSVVSRNANRLTPAEMVCLLPGRTRSAIIGAAHRLGISLATEGHSGRTLTRKRNGVAMPRPPTARTNHMERLNNRPPPAQPTHAPPPESVWFPLLGHPPVEIYDLEPHHCRWPVTGGFCGCHKMLGSAYCATHATIAQKGPNLLITPPAAA